MNFVRSSQVNNTIPYGRQLIADDDIQAVTDALQSDWLTTGPLVDAFEQALAQLANTSHAVAVSSGTAALHAAMYAIGIGPGDEVIVPPMTFAATANAVVFQQGTPVFSDVDPDTLLINPDLVEERITARTRAVIAVDFAGQPCDYAALKKIACRHGLVLVADACHALGAQYKGQPAGSVADLSIFSFHPVKHITTGEGGMITTSNPEFARRMRMFRNHCITTDHRERAEQGSWFYEMVDLGYNYRITDFQCALGLSQLKKLPAWIQRRQWIAERYTEAFSREPAVTPLAVRPDVEHVYHLYVIRLNTKQIRASREQVFTSLRTQGIGVNVHYIPVHLHPFYRNRFGTSAGLCPAAEAAYEEILSLPIFPGMSDGDVERVIATVSQVIAATR